MDIESAQREIATLQKQIKQLGDKVKGETDPKRKSILQKKMVDLNLKKNELLADLEDQVSSIDSDMELQLGENKMKLTNKEKQLVKEYAKKLVGKRLNEKLNIPIYQEMQSIVGKSKVNQFNKMAKMIANHLKSTEKYSNVDIKEFLETSIIGAY